MMIAGKVQVVLLLPGDGGGLIGERERELQLPVGGGGT